MKSYVHIQKRLHTSRTAQSRRLRVKLIGLLVVVVLALGIPAWHEQSHPPRALAEGPISTTWWFPWYDSVGGGLMNTWIMIANPGSTTASCNV